MPIIWGIVGDEKMLTGPTPDDLRAKIFEDRVTPRDWRVEKMDEDGGYEAVKVFTGPDAREQAIRYAEREFGVFDKIRLGALSPSEVALISG
jgi:hypothetical protein